MEIDTVEEMDIDDLCSCMSGINVISHLNIKLVNDLNLIIREISNKKTFDVDIYDICVSCGNDIVWNQEYSISFDDSNWLRKEGKTFFMNTLHSMLPINSLGDYHKANFLYNQICDLFLQSVV